jgi:hypothetical protein
LPCLKGADGGRLDSREVRTVVAKPPENGIKFEHLVPNDSDPRMAFKSETSPTSEPQRRRVDQPAGNGLVEDGQVTVWRAGQPTVYSVGGG